MLESSVSTQSLPSPTIKSSKSGPLKLGSSKVKNRPKAKQADSVKPESQSDNSTTTKELATSSSDSFTTISDVNVDKNIEVQQQRVEDNCTHSPEDDQALQPVTTSELLLLASTDTTEVSSSGGNDSNRVTDNKENQPDISSVPVQNAVTEDVDSSTATIAVLPVTTSDNQVAANKVNVADALEEAESDNVKNEGDSDKQNVSSSTSAVPEEIIKIIATPQSDEVSSTAEYVIVSKETLADKPATEPVSDVDVDKQSTEVSRTTEPVASNNSTAEQDLPQEEDKIEEKQIEQVSDNHSIEIQKAEDDNKESCLEATDTTSAVSHDNQASVDPQSHDAYHEEIQQLRSVSFPCVC